MHGVTEDELELTAKKRGMTLSDELLSVGKAEISALNDRKSVKLKTVGLGIVGVIVFILIISGAYYAGTQTATTTVTATKTVTTIEKVTTTFVVTSYVATVTTTPPPSVTRLEYVNVVKPILESSLDVHLLATLATQDFAKGSISSSEAKAAFLKASTTLGGQLSKLAMVKAPEELKSYHGRLVNALTLLQKGWQTAYDAHQYYPSDRSVTLLQEATNYIKSATSELQAAKSELDRLLG